VSDQPDNQQQEDPEETRRWEAAKEREIAEQAKDDPKETDEWEKAKEKAKDRDEN